MFENIANKLRPHSLNDIIGQEHLVGPKGILRQFVAKKHPLSIILYGPPGSGKTTIATVLANDLAIPYRFFNASTGNKKEIDAIITEAKMNDGLFVIVDEVHRLNKQKQDYLLPYIESGLLLIAGCTTANPYHSINPAIRSRCQILEVTPLSNQDIIKGLKKAIQAPDGLADNYQVDESVLEAIANKASGDIRFAYNCLEICSIVAEDNRITLDLLQQVVPKANSQYDKDEDQYYDTLSGLQKSIRGSDPNAAMYYLAKLIEADDIDSLERRVITTAYEDIGLANPGACMRTVTAFQGAKIVGFPEARILIAQAIIDLCLSPKSKSAIQAIDSAAASLSAKPLKAPKYLRLSPVGLDEDEKYDYSLAKAWEYIQYLPDDISNSKFYIPNNTSGYERNLAENYNRINNHGRTNDLKKLYAQFKKQKRD